MGTQIRLNIDVLKSEKFQRLCRTMRWSRAHGFGVLALMTHQTREAGFTEGRAEELYALLPNEPGLTPEFVRQLVDLGFVHQRGDSVEVPGNREHFEVVEKLRAAGKKGRARIRILPQAEGLQEPADIVRAPPRGARRAAAINKVHPLEAARREVERVTSRPDFETPAEAAHRHTWDAYQSAYLNRWQVFPGRNDRVNALLAQFVQLVGRKEAPEVIRFYVHHPEPAYADAQHTLFLAVRDASSLHTQWLRGEPTLLPTLDRRPPRQRFG